MAKKPMPKGFVPYGKKKEATKGKTKPKAKKK